MKIVNKEQERVFINSKTINTIDLWTEQKDNHYEIFNGAFVDGFDEGIPFNLFKIVRNCNCKINVGNPNLHITNKHNAIIFYKGIQPVRLMVINKNTDIDKCIKIAMEQHFNGKQLKEVYDKNSIRDIEIDLKEKSIYNSCDKTKEIDVGSCDRFALLYNMLKGSYTESDTKYGNYQSDIYEFMPNIDISYDLQTDNEHFVIPHKCGFINNLKTRIIPIQSYSSFTQK